MKKLDEVFNTVKKWIKITATVVVVIFIILAVVSLIRNRIVKEKNSDVLSLQQLVLLN